MHAKSVIYDRRAVTTGSVNMTNNGFFHNKEQMYVIADPDVVAEVVADFEETWVRDDCQIVTGEDLSKMHCVHDNEDGRKGKNKKKISSRSSASASRESGT